MALDSSQERYRNIMATLSKQPTNFPNTSTIAEFRPYSQTIHLHKIRRDEFAAAVAGDDYHSVRTQLETIMHETTHWADLIGTIWGRSYLVTIYNAIHAALSQDTGAENQFWRLVELHDFGRRVDYGDYYKHVTREAKGDPKVPWIIEYTSGNEFDLCGRLDFSRPIFFVRFLDRLSRTRVARQPLSVSALLETLATWSEISTGLEIVAHLTREEALIEEKLWARQQLESAYHPGLTEYTAPTHMLSAKTDTKDIITSYRCAAALCYIVLNLTDDLFDRLQHPTAFSEFDMGRKKAFVERRNHGYAFAVLCNHAPQWSHGDANYYPEWIEATLRAAGLPTRSEIMASAADSFGNSATNLIEGDLTKSAKHLLGLGEKLHSIRASEPDPAITMGRVQTTDMPTPVLFDEEGNPFGVHPNSKELGDYHPLRLYDVEMTLRERMNTFVDACR